MGPALDAFDAAVSAVPCTDLCDGEIDADVQSVNIPFPNIKDRCNNKFTRIYTLSATDKCGNAGAVSTAITATVNDNEPPTLTCDGADATNLFDICEGESYPSGYTQFSTEDNCDGITDLTVEPDCCTKADHTRVTRTWNLEDSCGNPAVACIQTINLSDGACQQQLSEA